MHKILFLALALLAAAAAPAAAQQAGGEDGAVLRPFGGGGESPPASDPPPPGPPPPPTAPPQGPPPDPERVPDLEFFIAGGEEGPALPGGGVLWPYAPHRGHTGPDGQARITLQEAGTYVIGVGANAAIQPWGGIMVVRVGDRSMMAPVLPCTAPEGMACPILWLTAEAGEQVEMTVETVIVQMMTRPAL